MSGHTARVRAGNDRTSLYTEITDKIIAELEAGRFPWVQPWGTAAIKAPLAMPRNAATQRGYSAFRRPDLWGGGVREVERGQGLRDGFVGSERGSFPPVLEIQPWASSAPI